MHCPYETRVSSQVRGTGLHAALQLIDALCQQYIYNRPCFGQRKNKSTPTLLWTSKIILSAFICLQLYSWSAEKQQEAGNDGKKSTKSNNISVNKSHQNTTTTERRYPWRALLTYFVKRFKNSWKTKGSLLYLRRGVLSCHTSH